MLVSSSFVHLRLSLRVPDNWIKSLQSWCSEHCSDFVLEGERVISWPVVGHDLAIRVDDELSEVPRDKLSLVLVFQIQLTLGAEEAVDWVGVLPIDVDFGEHGELDVVGAGGPFFDFSLGARLLATKLIAREGEDLEALPLVLLMELNHFFVVLVR